jgi:hypothetical protein
MASRRQRRRQAKEKRHTMHSSPLELRIPDRIERLAYTREQAATALGVSLATLDRRVVPVITTVRTEWGTRLIPVTELERFLAERRQEARLMRRRGVRPGRKSGLPPELIERIQSEHARGSSLGEIAQRLNGEGVPTSQGGRQWWPSTVRVVLAGPVHQSGVGAAAILAETSSETAFQLGP